MITLSTGHALDLCRRGRGLCRHHEYPARRNGLPGLSFPRPSGRSETCDTAGILNTAVNFAASIQVTEALKFLAGARGQDAPHSAGRDLWTNDQAEIRAAAPGRGAPFASSGILPISAGKIVRRSRCAAATRCRSMNTIGRSILPRCSAAWNPTEK